MEKAHLTLYTVIGSPQHILTGIQSLFAPVIQSVDTEADQIRVTLQDDSLLVFHLSHVREKAGFIEMHIEGMANYFAQAATSNQGSYSKPTITTTAPVISSIPFSTWPIR